MKFNQAGKVKLFGFFAFKLLGTFAA